MFKEKICPKCSAKDEHIKYLEKLVDNLLLKNGVAPIIKESPDMKEIEEDKIPEGVLRYGA